MADIPGLIEGASEGVGLGHAFLRHVERCRLIVHVVDVSGIEGRDPKDDFEKINLELANFSEELAESPQIVAANKSDMATEEQIEEFRQYIEACELDMGHVFAFTAVEAAYSNGTEWLEQCLAYIQGNIDYVDDFLRANAPKIKVIRPQASYLLWLDCREMGLTQAELNDFFVDKAHLALNDGVSFGEEGRGFMRLNVASPRSILEQAMKQLVDAYRCMQ
jgi:ribosome-binding ATPase YchF (GTP1/OBG family)